MAGVTGGRSPTTTQIFLAQQETYNPDCQERQSWAK